MASLHVLPHRQALDRQRLAGRTIVVIDVLFATSTIVSALQAGAGRVIAATGPDEARNLAARVPGALLAGELHGEVPPGFGHFAPLRLAAQVRPGQTLVYSSSNGTPAIRSAATASTLLVGALLNAPALARHINRQLADRTLLLLCAGTRGALNLEDFYCAGCLVDRLLGDTTCGWQPSDAALAALGLYRSQPALQCLRASRVGRLMGQRGLDDELVHAADAGASETIVVGRGGDLVAVRQR